MIFSSRRRFLKLLGASPLAVLLHRRHEGAVPDTGDGVPRRSFSGVYPHLASYNDENECGVGAVVAWAGRLNG